MINSQEIDHLFTQAGIEWLIKANKNNESDFLQQINTELIEVQDEINSRIALSDHYISLDNELKKNTSKLKPFIQTFAAPMTKVMRALVYFIVSDISTIQTLDLHYTQQESFDLRITLDENSSIYSLSNPIFKSTELWDVELIKNFGYMKLGKKPVIDGILPVKYN